MFNDSVPLPVRATAKNDVVLSLRLAEELEQVRLCLPHRRSRLEVACMYYFLRTNRGRR
jgi:hypothetical protein